MSPQDALPRLYDPPQTIITYKQKRMYAKSSIVSRNCTSTLCKIRSIENYTKSIRKHFNSTGKETPRMFAMDIASTYASILAFKQLLCAGEYSSSPKW
jgi:hypothetical protein